MSAPRNPRRQVVPPAEKARRLLARRIAAAQQASAALHKELLAAGLDTVLVPGPELDDAAAIVQGLAACLAGSGS